MVSGDARPRIVVQGKPQVFGISGNTAGTRGLSKNLTAFGPGGKAKAHDHKDDETALYGISGKIAVYYGHDLEHDCLDGRVDGKVVLQWAALMRAKA